MRTLVFVVRRLAAPAFDVLPRVRHVDAAVLTPLAQTGRADPLLSGEAQVAFWGSLAAHLHNLAVDEVERQRAQRLRTATRLLHMGHQLHCNLDDVDVETLGLWKERLATQGSLMLVDQTLLATWAEEARKECERAARSEGQGTPAGAARPGGRA